MNTRDKYVRSVFQTALYLWEMYEEGSSDTHTDIVWLLSDRRVWSRFEGDGDSEYTKRLVRHILNDLYRSQKVLLTEAAIELAKWLAKYYDAPALTQDIESELRAACAPHEREKQCIDETEKVDRSYIRLARYLLHRAEINLGADTRAFRTQTFNGYPISFPKGESHQFMREKPPKKEGEHVVPLAAIRDYCNEYFRDNQTLDENTKLKGAAERIRKWLVVIYTTPTEMNILGPGSAYQSKMPDGWECIYARLHWARIEFVPPESHPCTCNK